MARLIRKMLCDYTWTNSKDCEHICGEELIHSGKHVCDNCGDEYEIGYFWRNSSEPAKPLTQEYLMRIAHGEFNA